jgi:diguanylate cyclase (GGDEF)-like protein/PAS domain S-box-containing protein
MKRNLCDQCEPSTEAHTLREIAEAKVQSLQLDGDSVKSDEDIQRLVHELRVHEIELEMQNDELQRTQDVIEESRARYFDLYELAPVGYCTIDVNGMVLEANHTASELLGVASTDLVGQPFSRFIFKEDQDIFYLHRRKFGKTGDAQEIDLRLLRAEGTFFWALLRSIVPANNRDGSVLRLTISDMTPRKQAEESLRLAASVFTHAREGIAITDPDGTILNVNAAFTQITGYSRGELAGRNLSFLGSVDQDQSYIDAMWKDVKTKGHWYGEIWNRRKDGDLYAEFLTITAVHDDKGNIQNYIVLISDITVIKEQQNRLEHIAHYDALTNLPNRLLLAERLKQAMRQAQRREERIAVVYVDLDGFKQVNDMHGHSVGDQLLVALSLRMSEVLREGDSLARIGGDEFVAVLVDLTDLPSSILILERLLEAVSRPLPVAKLNLQVTVSLGVSFWPQAEDVDADQLVRQADQAMYKAKQSGRNRFHVFDAAQDRDVRAHHERVARIRQALDHREFVLHFQPKINMRTGALLGAEALIRWQHPKRGLLLPEAFLPIIQDTSLMIDLGNWVIKTALTQIEAWHEKGLSIPISVNASALQLQDEHFVSDLRALLRQHPGVSPGELELEVLETTALENFGRMTSVMAACRDLGVGFALDDFGTGYSSLTYLKQVPASLLKIDQSFVRDMLDDPDDLAILEGVLGLATAFRRGVIAEGVETLAHGEMLLRLGCEWGQGFAIARPMSAQDFEEWISSWDLPMAWKTLEPISRERLPVLSASVEHRAWTCCVVKYLAGKADRPRAQSAHECRFGSWLDDGGRQLLFGATTDHPLDVVHRKLHERGDELLALKCGGRTGEIEERSSELSALCDQMLDQLAEMYQP